MGEGSAEGQLPDLRPADRGAAQEKADDVTGEEAAAEAACLVLACPFATPAQREEFDAASRPVPGVPATGKPPAAVITELKARRARLERLMAQVPAEARQILVRVQQLRRIATKKSRKSKSSSKHALLTKKREEGIPEGGAGE